MQCAHCPAPSVIREEQPLCATHFCEHFENTVKDTITRFSLILPGQKIAVACSGGKDSTVLLHLLSIWGYDVTALAIDEGIAGYRDATLSELRATCERLKVRLVVESYQDAFGTTLDAYLTKHPNTIACAPCGVWRRKLLNLHARGFDALATGHNLDDEAQSVLMNLLGGNVGLLHRLGPRTGIINDPGFTPRVKPLYFCSEKSVATYALIKKLLGGFTECPNAYASYRGFVRDKLNDLEQIRPGSKRALLDWYVDWRTTAHVEAEPIGRCNQCGEPARDSACRACVIMGSSQ